MRASNGTVDEMEHGGGVDEKDMVIGQGDVTALGEGEKGTTLDDEPGGENWSSSAGSRGGCGGGDGGSEGAEVGHWCGAGGDKGVKWGGGECAVWL